jgi:leucyl/phenylalanyl-tRNA--protein transferase
MPAFAPHVFWLDGDQPFPPVERAWGPDTPAPGLLAAGGSLNLERLRCAYSLGIFPWFGPDQPPLWWCPDPRMVLPVDAFRVHASFQKTLRQFVQTPGCDIRMDSDFAAVIAACAISKRGGQQGTWIGPSVMAAYGELHQAGLAHSVETWRDGQLIGGLYVVALGRSVFGESMFSRVSNASKIALAALVAFCRQHGVLQIDCQQNTAHLASLGAREIPRSQFLAVLRAGLQQPLPTWRFERSYWSQVLAPSGTVQRSLFCPVH